MMYTTTTPKAASTDSGPQVLPAHVVVLGSYIPPHQLATYTAWAQRVERLTILVSTMMERHRNWPVNWGTLEVVLQRTLTIRRPWRHTAGFTDAVDVHIPWDTFGQLRKLRGDVLITSEMGFRSLCSAIYRWRHPRTPLILWACVSEHTEQGRGWLRSRLRKWLIRRVDAVIVNGASGRRYISGLGFDEDRIFEIPYTCPPGMFDQGPVHRDAAQAHRLLYCGQLIERKGVQPFLSALSAWARDNPGRRVEMTLVGSGPLQTRLQHMGFPENLSVTFAGRRKYEELAGLYGDAGIMVFPTLADEWGLVVNEALAAGLPVLGSVYSASVEELCREGETGWVFRPDAPEETYAAIDRALTTTPERLNQMRTTCRARVEPLNPQRSAERLVELIRSVLSRPTRSRPHV